MSFEERVVASLAESIRNDVFYSDDKNLKISQEIVRLKAAQSEWYDNVKNYLAMLEISESDFIKETSGEISDILDKNKITEEQRLEDIETRKCHPVDLEKLHEDREHLCLTNTLDDVMKMTDVKAQVIDISRLRITIRDYYLWKNKNIH